MTSIYDMADEWNDGGTTFTAIKMDVTDTASASDSLLLDLLVGGSSKFQVTKSGSALINGRTGIGEPFANYLSLYAGSTEVSRMHSSGEIRFGAGTLAFGANMGTQDLKLLRDAAGTLAQRNGANAQTFNLYSTYTDPSNFARLGIGFNGGNVEILQEYAGTGSRAGLTIGNDLAWWRTTTAGNVSINYHNGDLDFDYRGSTQVSFANNGNLQFNANGSVGTAAAPFGSLNGKERSSDLSDPPEGQFNSWMSDGTGSGDDGDIMMKITAGGVTKTVTLVDFSAAP